MDIYDLEYLLENNPFKYKNYYKKISSTNLAIQNRYLRSSEFNYRVVRGKKELEIGFKF